MPPTRDDRRWRPPDGPVQRHGRAGPRSRSAPGRWTLAQPGRRCDDPAAVEPATAGGVFPLDRPGCTPCRGLHARPGDGATPPAPSRSTSRSTRRAPRATRPRTSRSGNGSARVRRAVFRVLVSASRLLAGRGRRRVLFTSRLISEMSGNLRVVHDRMVERGLDREYDLLTDAQARHHRALARSSTGCAWPARSAGADVIVLDDSFPPLNWVKLSTRTSGSSSCGTPRGRSRPSATAGSASPAAPIRSRASTRTTPHAIVSSEFDVPFYAEAFGIPEERVVPTGIPRMDRFFDDDGAGRRAARRRAPRSRRSSAG